MLWKRNGDNRKDAPNPREKFLAAISNAIAEALDGGLFDRGATKPRHGLRALSFGLRSHRCGNNQRTMIVVSYLKPAKPCCSSTKRNSVLALPVESRTQPCDAGPPTLPAKPWMALPSSKKIA